MNQPLLMHEIYKKTLYLIKSFANVFKNNKCATKKTKKVTFYKQKRKEEGKEEKGRGKRRELRES